MATTIDNRADVASGLPAACRAIADRARRAAVEMAAADGVRKATCLRDVSSLLETLTAEGLVQALPQ